MAAQLGSSIVLSYGPQGSQQVGSAILLQEVGAVVGGRRVVRNMRGPWAAAQFQRIGVQAPYETPVQADITSPAPWTRGVRLDDGQGVPWITSARRDDDKTAPWGRYERRLQPESVSVWTLSRPMDDSALVPWGEYERWLQAESLTPWLPSRPMDDSAFVPWGGPMVERHLDQRARFSTSLPADWQQWVPWVQFSRTLQPGFASPIPEDDGLPEPFIVVPIRSVYIVINNVSLFRVDNGAPVPALSMSLSLDVDSWTWGFNASLPGAALPLVEPTSNGPVELQATVNGAQFRVLAESVARERAFGQVGIRVTGRGRNAVLDAPYAPQTTFANDTATNAQQLMDAVLTDNGVSLGYEIGWGLTDWLVPAGVFTHQGTYITALSAIAKAAGAYLRPHTRDLRFDVIHKYPNAPWEWASVDPDYELPAAVVTRESLEWKRMPDYNRVFVAGQQQGVLGQVTRIGTAGDLVAPMIVDPLITHADAARQRGLAVLGDTGRQMQVGLRMPVLAETGVIKPGAFVKYVDGGVTRLGLVRSTQVEVSMPGVFQTLGVESHA
jgi:hypothetical protein